MTLPYQDARDLVDAARARALDPGKALSIAVVDYGGGRLFTAERESSLIIRESGK